nr:hypothetical protein [Rhizobium phaseoli]
MAINRHRDFFVRRDERFALSRQESYHVTAIVMEATPDLHSNTSAVGDRAVVAFEGNHEVKAINSVIVEVFTRLCR